MKSRFRYLDKCLNIISIFKIVCIKKLPPNLLGGNSYFVKFTLAYLMQELIIHKLLLNIFQIP
jgi:hypothetical protein